MLNDTAKPINLRRIFTTCSKCMSKCGPTKNREIIWWHASAPDSPGPQTFRSFVPGDIALNWQTKSLQSTSLKSWFSDVWVKSLHYVAYREVRAAHFVANGVSPVAFGPVPATDLAVNYRPCSCSCKKAGINLPDTRRWTALLAKATRETTCPRLLCENNQLVSGFEPNPMTCRLEVGCTP